MHTLKLTEDEIQALASVLRIAASELSEKKWAVTRAAAESLEKKIEKATRG